MKSKTSSILMLGIGLSVGILVGYTLKDSTSRSPQQSANAFVLKDYFTASNTDPTAREAAAQPSDGGAFSYFPKELVERMDRQGYRVEWRINEGRTSPSKSILFQKMGSPRLNSPDRLVDPHFRQTLDLIDLRYEPPQLELR